ncbi:uncharacterized protein LOC101861812 [Aplysia californica]|uniref:Uncharacterized protein LOC101861812 n=1 Tax=Aplysia californica TaxID=6500 RepID=A0ABM0JP51_APLCA|nr:uncharacterized protein LOC101861812 [Aplysia californica]
MAINKKRPVKSKVSPATQNSPYVHRDVRPRRVSEDVGGSDRVSIGRWVALFAVVLAVTGCLVSPDVRRVLVRLQKTGLGEIFADAHDPSVRISSNEKREAKEEEVVGWLDPEPPENLLDDIEDDGGWHEDQVDEDELTMDDFEDGVIEPEDTEDLMEDEIVEKERRDAERQEKEYKLKAAGNSASDGKGRSSKVAEEKSVKSPKTTSESGDPPLVRGRPGRDKNAPPPIILRPGDTHIKLDASQIKFVDSPVETKDKKQPKSQDSAHTAKKSKSSVKSVNTKPPGKSPGSGKAEAPEKPEHNSKSSAKQTKEKTAIKSPSETKQGNKATTKQAKEKTAIKSPSETKQGNKATTKQAKEKTAIKSPSETKQGNKATTKQAKEKAKSEIPERPGGNKNGPPPIVLKPGDNTILDTSQIKFVDSPEKEKPMKSKASKVSAKKSTPSSKSANKKSAAESPGKNKDETPKTAANVPSSSEERAKEKVEANSSENSREKQKQTNVDKSEAKTIPKTSKSKSDGVGTAKEHKPIILNGENDKIVIDPSTLKQVNPEVIEPSKSKTKTSDKSTSMKKDSAKVSAKKQGDGKIKEDTDSNNGVKEKVNKFRAKYQKTITPKKVFIDGRRIPPTELLHQKASNSSVKVYLFNDFLSDRECDGLIKAHDSHVKALDKQPLICFDSIKTLRSHLKEVKKSSVKVTPNDFTAGTICLNSTFSAKMQMWMKSNWSYSTAFYPGESQFSTRLAARIEQAMGLSEDNGGKFQITSYPVGKAYKEHTDCILGGTEKRDRMASVLMYLNDVEDGGETSFPDLGIWVKPRKGRALLWNNMNPEGFCEPHSKHVAKVVKKGSKYILIRWYYYKSFYALGKRQPAPNLPARDEAQPMVRCDEYEMGSCRWYDEWNHDVTLEYQKNQMKLL